MGVTTLKQGVVGDSVRLIYCDAADAGIADMTLDGNKANNTTQEHRHGTFLDGSTRFRIERVAAQNFTGDGFYLYTDADHTTIKDCYSTGNERNGLTLGGSGQTGARIIDSIFVDSTAQQIDSEPGGPVTDVVISGCYLDSGASDQAALTISGFSAASRSDGWTVTNNVINGPVFQVWADNTTITGNKITSNATELPAVYIYRTCKGVVVSGNQLRATANVHAGDNAVVLIYGTGAGDSPSNVTITGNSIKQDLESAIGIYCSGCIDVTIEGNTLRGSADSAVAGYYGIVGRATIVATPFRSFKVLGNYIQNFAAGGVAIYGSGASTMLACDVSYNTFDSTFAGVQPIGVAFDLDGAGAALRCTGIGNMILGEVAYVISDYPGGTGKVLLIGGNWRRHGIYSCIGDPAGVINDWIGSVAFRRDGGAATCMYVKESGDQTTAGWVAK